MPKINSLNPNELNSGDHMICDNTSNVFEFLCRWGDDSDTILSFKVSYSNHLAKGTIQDFSGSFLQGMHALGLIRIRRRAEKEN